MELYVVTKEEWRKWLNDNHNKSEEVWLIYYKKPSGKPRIPYIDAVEEALCYGWIDGKIKRINDDYYIQRFTPRRKGSRWSKYNIERVHKLIKQGIMKKHGLDAFSEAVEKPELIYENRPKVDPTVPVDLMVELEKNETAFNNFMNFSRSSRQLYVEWLNSAKKSETRQRRIDKIIRQATENIKPGMM